MTGSFAIARSCFLAVLLAAAAFFAPSGASAGVVFNMTGVCTSIFCGSTGQTAGDPVSGWVEFENFDSAADGAFLIPDEYYLEFGNVVLDSSVPNFSAPASLRSGLDTFQKIDASTLGPGTFRVWSTDQNVTLIFMGNCFNCADDQWLYGFAPGSSGTYEFVRETPLAVPAPGALVPFAVAFLLAAGLVARRQTR